MKQKQLKNLVSTFRISLLKSVAMNFPIILLLVVSGGQVYAQGCSIALKIKDPVPVCSPSTVDLTSTTVTAGSTPGLMLYYYSDVELTTTLSSPDKVSAGTYYIKGVLTGYCTGFAVATVKATVFQKPRVVIPNPVIKRANGSVDLTLPQRTTGSDAELTFSYWNDIELTRPVSSPQSPGNGIYYIKGTSGNGCFDSQTISVND